VVIPVLNENELLGGLLAQLQEVGELIVVDGGSSDRTCEIAALMGAQLLHSKSPNRGAQMAMGAANTSRPYLLFLHADARLERGWCGHLAHAIMKSDVSAAAFRLEVQSPGWRLRLLEWLVYLRSMWFQLPYGDQGLALTRQKYDLVGGYLSLPLMEDLDLVQRLQKLGKLVQTPAKIKVSGRRWERLGVWRSCWRNAKLRAAWRRGVDPGLLATRYRAYQNTQRLPFGSRCQPWLE
jgi:rSAM/selenodomain-associated transferase 2